jgi:chitodextrinase
MAPRATAMPTEKPDESWGTNGRVSAIVQIGNTVYIGGKFTELREDGGAGPGVLSRSNLAAFDATTGEPTDWAPKADGEVLAMAPSPDETRIYIGGRFTSVSGSSRRRIAAVKTGGSGTVDGWKPLGPNATVLSVAATASKVYIGGDFNMVGDVTRSKLAAYSADTAAVDAGWAPSADERVRSVVVSPDGDRVFAGGNFTVVSGQPRKNAVALTAAGGEVISTWHPDPGENVWAFAVKDDNVYTAIGGSSNSVANYDYDSGERKWRRRADGDFQALAVSGEILYAGGHWERFEGEVRRKLVALDADTGALRRDWAPKLPSSSTTWFGVAALSTYGESRLAVGGDFTHVSGYTHERYAQWTGTIGGMANDTTPPSNATNLKASAYGGSRIDLSWTASTDNDAVANYNVYRNGSKIATPETARFSDTTVSPSRIYTYHVVAVDFAGNTSSASNTAGATTGPANETKTFVAVEDSYVDADSATSNYGESSSLKVAADPARDILLKFDLSGTTGRHVLSAKLRLYNTEGSTDGGDFHRALSNSWSEDSVTWNDAPAADEAVAYTLDDVDPGKWAEADITPLVKGDGALSLRVTPEVTDGATFSSSEATNKPQLVVTLAAAGTTLPQDKLFEDGFESGDFSRWTDAWGMSARTSDVASGSWAARANSTGQATYAYKELPVSERELFYRTRFKINSQVGHSVMLLRFRTGAGTSLVTVFLTSTGRLAVRNEVTAATSTDTSTVAGAQWHRVELHAAVSETDPEIEVWLDGNRVLSRGDSLGKTAIGQVQLGEKATGKSYDISFDDVVAEASQGVDMPPSTPANLRATAATDGRQVSLTWDASSDDTGVTGYDIYRDGALLATVGSTTSYTDASVSPATPYQYTLRARDGAGNVSSFSAPASITTPGPDSTPPTAPSDLSAVPISFDRVDLKWTAATDAVGVTGYRVRRDGEQIGTVSGTTTSYSDLSVAPATSYMYTVEAVDAAGNVSPPATAVTATTPHRTVFRDGFESGDFSQWTDRNGSFSVSQGSALAGSFGARAKSTGSATYVYKTLASQYGELAYEVRFKVVSQGSSSLELVRFRTAGGSSILKVYVTSSSRLAMRNEPAGITTYSATTAAKGSWHTLRVQAKVGGSSASRTAVNLDGLPVADLSKTTTLGTTPIGRVDLGDDDSGETYEVHYDEVVVDAPPANSQPPTISGSARDGETLTAHPGSWSGTEPLSYAYQWRRCDAFGADCADIPGATETSYRLTPAEVGSTIRVRVRATNAAGGATRDSEPTGVVEAQ